MPRTYPKGSPLQTQIKALYAQGIGPTRIAEITGRSVGSITVIASRLGVTSKLRHDPHRYRRPFVIPDAKWNQYLDLARHGLTATERARIIGIDAPEWKP